jgi:hypothetical protein
MGKVKIKIKIPKVKERRRLPPPPRTHKDRTRYDRAAEKRRARREIPE